MDLRAKGNKPCPGRKNLCMRFCRRFPGLEWFWELKPTVETVGCYRSLLRSDDFLPNGSESFLLVRSFPKFDNSNFSAIVSELIRLGFNRTRRPTRNNDR